MTQAVFFDVLPKNGFVDAYFAMAVGLRSIVEKNPGFISVERFKNLQHSDWYLSFSNWANEESLAGWRCQPDHSSAQVCGRSLILEDYRLRVGSELGTEEGLEQLGGSERIATYIGNFEAIEDAVSEIKMPDITPRLFRGVIDPMRGIALVELSKNQSIPLTKHLSNDLYEIRCFDVVRDYGMFNRAQAPQQFI